MCGGWTGASERSWLVDGPSPSTVLVPAQSKSRRLAAKACWAGWVRMADQRERRQASTAWRRMSGAAVGLVRAGKRRTVVASWLHRPPISRAKTTSRHLLERRSSGYVRSLGRRASWSARLRGWLGEVRGDTKVVGPEHRELVTSAASRCFASIVNKVRLQLDGISPFESKSLYKRKIFAAKLVGMCLHTSATNPHSSPDLFNFNFSTAPMSSCNVQGSSVK